MFFFKTLFLRSLGCSVLFILIGLMLTQDSLASTINGFVYDQQRNPISRVDVELLNENYRALRRTRTDDIGRYQFSGLNDGRFYVRVLAFRLNLQDQTIEVLINTLSLLGTGNGSFEQDFYLRRKKGRLSDTTTGVVYIQEVPREAENLYKKAAEDFGDKKQANGVKKLVEALEIFPRYYAASQLLGIELMKSGQYLNAVKFFMKAAEINPKSSRSFYYMGFSLNELGKKYNRSALLALDKAVILAPASWQVVYLMGKIHREEGNYLEAEKFLLKSKKLSDKKMPEIHKELAELYGNNLKKYDKAADELELYLKSSKKKDPKIRKVITDLRNKARKNT